MKKSVWIVTNNKGEIQDVFEREADAHRFADKFEIELYVDKYEVK